MFGKLDFTNMQAGLGNRRIQKKECIRWKLKGILFVQHSC